MLCQLLSQVGLACPTGSTQNNPAMLQQQWDIPLDDRFGNHCLKRQWVHTRLLGSCHQITKYSSDHWHTLYNEKVVGSLSWSGWQGDLYDACSHLEALKWKSLIVENTNMSLGQMWTVTNWCLRWCQLTVAMIWGSLVGEQPQNFLEGLDKYEVPHYEINEYRSLISKKKVKHLFYKCILKTYFLT